MLDGFTPHLDSRVMEIFLLDYDPYRSPAQSEESLEIQDRVEVLNMRSLEYVSLAASLFVHGSGDSHSTTCFYLYNMFKVIINKMQCVFVRTYGCVSQTLEKGLNPRLGKKFRNKASENDLGF